MGGVWQFAEKYKTERLLQTDVNYHNFVITKTHNTFWISVITAY